jgi:hypothetical protein
MTTEDPNESGGNQSKVAEIEAGKFKKMQQAEERANKRDTLYPVTTIIGAAVVGLALGFIIGRKYQEEELEWRDGRRWIEKAYSDAADRLSSLRLGEEAPKALDSMRQKACQVGDKLKFW